MDQLDDKTPRPVRDTPKRIADVAPHLVAQWHPDNKLDVSAVRISSTKTVMWRGACSHVWSAPIVRRVNNGTGCPICAGKVVQPGFNDFLSHHPDVAERWHPENHMSPDEVTRRSHKEFRWRCEIGHEWVRSVRSEVKYNRCPVCSGQMLLEGFNDLATLEPEIAAQWSRNNDRKPTEFLRGSKCPVEWVCDKSHTWTATINSRTNKSKGTGCPVCAGKSVLSGVNDLATTSPELVAEWSPRNALLPTQVTRGSKKYVWWQCSLGHGEWEAQVNSRVGMSSGCPTCAGKVVVPGVNDLEHICPEAAAQWSHNNELAPSEVHVFSGVSALWDCPVHGEFTAGVSDRTANGSGCRRCCHAGRASTGEVEVAQFVSGVVGEHRVATNVTDAIGNYELDLLIEDLKIAIEYQGVYWHSEASGKDNTYHALKQQACADAGLRLVQVWEDDWRDRRTVVERMLRYRLGVSNERKVDARACDAVTVPVSEARAFMEINHIQGFTPGSWYDGLRTPEGELVAVMISLRRKHDHMISRYATACMVRGGFGRLASHSQKRAEAVGIRKLVTFADISLSDGELYLNTGFTVDGKVPPDYSYVVRGTRHHKFNYRIARFRDDPKLQYVAGATERELALMNRIHRVWDSGKVRFARHF